MTLSEIEALPKEMLTAADVASYLGGDPQFIRLQARANPAKLGFPVVVIGNRVKIPKAGFVAYCKGEAK